METINLETLAQNQSTSLVWKTVIEALNIFGNSENSFLTNGRPSADKDLFRSSFVITEIRKKE